MSHFTYIKTHFHNLNYLQSSLEKLNFRKIKTVVVDTVNQTTDLIIPQSNGYDIKFSWNGQEYELITDLSFWNQPQPLEIFLEKIAQQYALETIVDEMEKLGFQTVSQKNTNTAEELVTINLSRYNSY